jgi:hypothetical protein
MDPESIAPMVISTVLFFLAFGTGVVAMWLKSREKERKHRERMFMAEKGLPIPQELYGAPPAKKPNGFKRSRAWLLFLGWLLVAIGLGVVVFLGIQQGFAEGAAGFIVILIGASFLLSERLILKMIVRENGDH